MTKLERRDRRRAKALWRAFCQDNLFNPPWVINFEPSAVLFIAAALKRERDETSMAAAQWFLFSGKNEKAKVKRVLSKPGAKASFGAEQKKGKR